MKTVPSANAAFSANSAISAITAVVAVAAFATFAALVLGLLGAPAFAQAPVIVASQCQFVGPDPQASCCPPGLPGERAGARLSDFLVRTVHQPVSPIRSSTNAAALPTVATH